MIFVFHYSTTRYKLVLSAVIWEMLLKICHHISGGIYAHPYYIKAILGDVNNFDALGPFRFLDTSS